MSKKTVTWRVPVTRAQIRKTLYDYVTYCCRHEDKDEQEVIVSLKEILESVKNENLTLYSYSGDGDINLIKSSIVGTSVLMSPRDPGGYWPAEQQ